MPKKINKNICLLAIISALVAGALIWLAFFKQLGKISEMSDDIQKEQLDSLVQQQKSQKIADLGKELGDIEKSKEKMDALFVEKENAVPFIKTLESAAAATGNAIKITVIDLSKIKTSTAKKPVVQDSEAESKEDIKKENQTKKTASSQAGKQDLSNLLGFSVELSGEYRSIVDFFIKLENFPYFVRVYEFQIIQVKASQTSQSAGSGVIQTPNQENQAEQTEKEKNITNAILTIGVYTNEKK